jgi:hypothetical protein
MGVIKQFNNVDGGNQIYVDDFKNISDAAHNALAALPWTRPVAICNAFITGDNNGLSITPATLVAINGVVFGSDITATVTNTQYLYAVCEYDTTTPRTDSMGSPYHQAVTRKLRVSDSPLPSTDLSNASVFPGIGTYLIMAPGLLFNSSVVMSGSSFAPFTADIVGNGYVTNQRLADGAVSKVKIGDNEVNYEKVAAGAVKHHIRLPEHIASSTTKSLSNENIQIYSLIRSAGNSLVLTLNPDNLPVGTTADVYISNSSSSLSSTVKVLAPSGSTGSQEYIINANDRMHLSITRMASKNVFVARNAIESFGVIF